MPTPPINAVLFPPNGLDRASGTNGLPGTPTPANSIFIIDPVNGISINPTDSTFFEEYPDYPIIERAEQATITHQFACDQTTGNALLAAYGRGTVVQDSAGNLTRVLSNTLKYNKGGYCTLTMVAEGLSFDSPPDLFSIEIIELNPPAEKHPRYNQLTYEERYTVRNANITDATDLKQQFESIINTFPGAPSTPNGPVDTNLPTEYNEAKELLLKLFKGEESFYLPGYRITWSKYFWYPQFIGPGGYIEDPIGSANLPYFFWSIDGTEDPGNQTQPGIWSNSWFAYLNQLNPVMYANGISWLRLATLVEYERTWFKITETWQGGPLGHWDNEWYNIQNGQQPYQIDADAAAIVL